MIGMNFAPFLTLLVVGFIAAFVMHSIVRYRILAGFDGFLGKWIAGWIGGWLGSPVIGHWGGHVQNVYVVPALIGAFAGAFLVTFGLSGLAIAVKSEPLQKVATSVEMRKAS